MVWSETWWGGVGGTVWIRQGGPLASNDLLRAPSRVLSSEPVGPVLLSSKCDTLQSSRGWPPPASVVARMLIAAAR